MKRHDGTIYRTPADSHDDERAGRIVRRLDSAGVSRNGLASSNHAL